MTTLPEPLLICPDQTCRHGKGGGRYTTKSQVALASHIQKRHPEEMKPLPRPPEYRTIQPTGKRAVVYLRVSTIDQHPENQLPAIKTFAGLRGYHILEGEDDQGRPRGLFEDKASGKDTNRPELQRLLAYSVSGHPPPFDVVVFRRLSRLGRSLKDNIGLFDHFQALGVALISVEEPYDTTTPSGRLIRNVLASVHEYQRENMIEEVREGLARRKAQGKKNGRHRIGCGVPVDLGGLGPCPDGVNHKTTAADLIALSERRAKWRDQKARSRLNGLLRVQRAKNELVAQDSREVVLEASRGQTPSGSAGVSGPDNPPPQEA